jgi:hypothetical protein
VRLATDVRRRFGIRHNGFGTDGFPGSEGRSAVGIINAPRGRRDDLTPQSQFQWLHHRCFRLLDDFRWLGFPVKNREEHASYD